MTGLRAATAFLTRVPVAPRGEGDADPVEIAAALPWFPVVGALVGTTVALVYLGVRELVPSLPAAAVAVAAGMVLTGAFHEDGLADSADALGAWEPDEARRILKDPTHGTYGVSALVLVLVVRVSALAALDGGAALAVLPAAHALARAAALGTLLEVPAATDAGLGASYAAHATHARVLATVGVGLTLALVSIGPALFLPAAVLAQLGAAGAAVVGSRRIGGVTGDVLGAAEQVGETFVLLLGTAVASHAWLAVPWWR